MIFTFNLAHKKFLSHPTQLLKHDTLKSIISLTQTTATEYTVGITAPSPPSNLLLLTCVCMEQLELEDDKIMCWNQAESDSYEWTQQSPGTVSPVSFSLSSQSFFAAPRSLAASLHGSC